MPSRLPRSPRRRHAPAPHPFLMSGQRGSKICDRKQPWNISHFKVSFNSIGTPFHRGRGFSMGGPWIRGGGEVSRARDFCLSGGSNRHSSSARVSAFTATLTCYCLEGCVYLSAASYSGPETALLIPVSLSGWRMEIPGFRTRLILDSLIRNGSVLDLDQGFLGMTARAFGALRAAPLLSRTPREDREIGESAWRLRRASSCRGSIPYLCKNEKVRQFVWIKILVRLSG